MNLPLIDLKQSLARKLQGRLADSDFVMGLSCSEDPRKGATIKGAFYGSMKVSCRDGDVEVLDVADNAPMIVLKGKLLEKAHSQNLEQWSVSRTHDKNVTIAFLMGFSQKAQIIGVGVDITFGQRIRDIINTDRVSECFISRLLHSSEMGLLDVSSAVADHLARLWVIKEAVYKAIPSPKPSFWACLRKIIVGQSTIDPKIRIDDSIFCTTNSVHVALSQKEDMFTCIAVLVRGD